MVTSSSTLRACSTTTSASSALCSKISAVSRSTTEVTTGSAWAPIAAIVATSPAMPPAPVGVAGVEAHHAGRRGLLLQGLGGGVGSAVGVRQRAWQALQGVPRGARSAPDAVETDRHKPREKVRNVAYVPTND